MYIIKVMKLVLVEMIVLYENRGLSKCVVNDIYIINSIIIVKVKNFGSMSL